MKPLTVGSLFSGIGGIDLGLQRAGFQIKWQVENDPFCTKVLQKHWPHVARYGDVRTVGRNTLANVDLIAGGFPCQPHSLAGERQASQDERNLWPEFYRIICELRPRWVLVENVLGLLSSEDGCFFGNILRDLAQAGYDAEWTVLQAADVGAPHKRERVFIVAYPASRRLEECETTTLLSDESCAPSHVANPMCSGWKEQHTSTIASATGHPAWRTRSPGRAELEDSVNPRFADTWNVSPSQVSRREEPRWIEGTSGAGRPSTGNATTGVPEPRICRVLDGIPSKMDRLNRDRWPVGPDRPQYDWEPPRVISERQPNQSSRLKALGNAVVPQLAEWIGRRIIEQELPNE